MHTSTDVLSRRRVVEEALEKSNGVLRLDPAWVARDFLPPAGRLGLSDTQRDVGERGAICERWLASTTAADNRVHVPDEGLSFVSLESDERLTLKETVQHAGPSILGKEYAATHTGLGRLPKILDYALRLPFHFHHMKQHAALVGQNSKEEAYYFPEDADMGDQPDSYFGLHPSMAQAKQRHVFLHYLEEWSSDRILSLSKAYRLKPGDGFHIPPGVVHAPGSALTIELQEDSDVFGMLQGLVTGRPISKDLLFKDVRPEDRQKYGEKIILEMIDWETSGDPYFFEHRHTPPMVIQQNTQPGGRESWIFYNTTRFSGKQLVVHPGQSYMSVDAGVVSILVWKGKGTFDGHEIEGGTPGRDELLVVHDKAVTPVTVQNTGKGDLVMYKFFGPDVNRDVPMLPKYSAA